MRHARGHAGASPRGERPGPPEDAAGAGARAPARPRPAWATWGRRLVTLPVLAIGAAAYLALLPALLLAGALADVAGRRPWACVRTVLYVGVYIACEVAGVAAAFLAWAASGVWAGASRARFLRWNVTLQTAWGTALYRAAERAFRMRTEVEGLDDLGDGPFLVLIRHVSTADTLLPVVYLTRARGIVLRYVLKKELLWDPCLDIVGNRLPNCFVRRGSGESAREIAAVQRLLDGLGPREGVLIYPEGTRFTPAKRERILARLAAGADRPLYERAARLRHVLPPRLGGTLGLLDRNPGADVLFCAHTGLEGAGSIPELLGGRLVGTTVRVRFWRVPFGEIPADGDARVAWLYEQWRRVDAWVGERR
jgi:1-acyl-sn-glycerol-3-phosphate acyltransferase